MTFGNIHDFCIEAYLEPSGLQWRWFGRMCIYIQGTKIGDLQENHCSLYHATDVFRCLLRQIESLWDERFVGRSDGEIFEQLDRALYRDDGQTLETMQNDWAALGEYNFLTNTGEQFDDAKTFIICRPDETVHVLYEFRDRSTGSLTCTVQSFRTVAEQFLHWIDDQVEKAAPPWFSVNPLKDK